MANGYNPYQGGNIQSMVQQYGDVGLQKSKSIQDILAQKTMQGIHIKEIKKQIEAIQRKAKKKGKRRGIFGGLLSLGSMFLPGGFLLKSLVGSALAGGTAASTKKMLEKSKGQLESLKSGTLADRMTDQSIKQTEEQIENLDPVKAALESFIASSVTAGIGKGIDKVKAGKAAKAAEASDASNIVSSVDYPQPGVKTGVMDIPYGKTPTLKAQTPVGVSPYSGNITTPTKASQYQSISSPSLDSSSNIELPDDSSKDFTQAASPITSNRMTLKDFDTGKLMKLLAAYKQGAGPAFGQTALSDEDLLTSLIAQIQGGN